MPRTPRTCTAAGCERPTVAKGLCMPHYKRQRAGRPLDTGPRPGDPDGHGRYGVLETDGERVMCHDCGRWYTSLGIHVHLAHDTTARQYRLAHGLPLTRGLVAPAVSEAMSQRAAARMGTPGWQALEAARDPAAASAARDDESRDAISQAARRRETTPHLPQPTAPDPTVHACEACGATYCRLPGTGKLRRTCSRACAQARLNAHKAQRARTRHRERNGAIRAALAAGASVSEVARTHDLTRTRIRQIRDTPPT